MKKVAFDIDGTLWKIRQDKERNLIDQVPDYDLINVLRWFYNNGDKVYVWSAGGMNYAQHIVDKLGLSHMVTVIPKKGEVLNDTENNLCIPVMDIAFDDGDTDLAKVDVMIDRSNEIEIFQINNFKNI